MVKVGIVFCLCVLTVVYNSVKFMYKQNYSPGLGGLVIINIDQNAYSHKDQISIQ